MSRAEEIAQAAKDPDWGQVVANGGPPCFHVKRGRFCLRAKQWIGHGKADHAYVPLAAALESYAAEKVAAERERCAKIALAHRVVCTKCGDKAGYEIAARIREGKDSSI